MREFLHLLVSSIARNNTLFVGAINQRAPLHNMVELEKNTYYYVGAMLATSIVHGGPPPCFFSNAVADYLLYGMRKFIIFTACEYYKLPTFSCLVTWLPGNYLLSMY